MTSLTILILTGKRQTLNIQERRFMKEKRTNFCRRCAQKKKKPVKKFLLVCDQSKSIRCVCIGDQSLQS